MPQIRKSSPRRRDRRSRSRSRSPRGRRHSSSRSRDHRSRSRDRRRSRSPQRKRSPERRHRSPPRKRSPSPRRRRSRSRSRSPARKARHSSTPSDRGYIVKRPADSSGKRPGYRSRSPSPVQKRSRDDRSFREESPRDSRRSRRSQSPSTSYGGRMYSDQPSSSKQPLFPAGTSSRKQEIDYVTIVEKGPKREKLDKRFETLEQVAQGAFDFEENITIGIHRGPQHIQLHEDEDIEVNYEFNPKTFKMLFPKKEYHKAIFDRDEIKAFHHDDVLDEEAYVEKRTISIKPVDKPKSRKYGDDFDYKITVGSDREGYGDRRMVHDSGSRSRPSRSSRYEDIPVTVRLDPKPDPRYEKIYKEQQRNEDESLMSERIKRNPNDLRHNLLRRKSDGDRVDRGDRGDRSRDDRGRDDSRREDSRRDAHTLQDARSRIQARREGVSDSRRDRSAPDRSTSDRRRSPPRHDERKKRVTQTSLPDFKNRPDTSWGHCNVCNLALNSEDEAVEHIKSLQHLSNERAFGMTVPQESDEDHGIDHDQGSMTREEDAQGRRIRGRGSTRRKFAQIESGSEDEDRISNVSFGMAEMAAKSRKIGPLKDTIWIVGTEDMMAIQDTAFERSYWGKDLGLKSKNISIVWKCLARLRIQDVCEVLERMSEEHDDPCCIILHVGRNDLEHLSKSEFIDTGKDMLRSVKKKYTHAKLVWSQLLPSSKGTNPTRKAVDDILALHCLEAGGCYMFYPKLEIVNKAFFMESDNGSLTLTITGCETILKIIRGGIASIMLRNITIVPVLQGVGNLVNEYIISNIVTGRFAQRPKTKRRRFRR